MQFTYEYCQRYIYYALFFIYVRILLELLELRIVSKFLKFQNRTKILLFENKQFSSLLALKRCKLNGISFFP